MSLESDYAPSGAPITGRRVLLIVLAFFAVVITANMTMLSFALRNFSGLVVENSYVASQRFEADRAAAQAAALTGWAIDVVSDGATVALHIRDAEGAPVSGAALSGVIGRRSHEREDRAVSFAQAAPGLYQVAESLRPGAWRLTLTDAASPGVARKVDFAARGAR